MEDEKITLDRESFKALASDTRVSILKSLARRRKMLAELSKELGMSPSTVKEHMESLTSAGLAVMIDDGHKWKYYELTRKGKNVLDPGQAKVWIMLSISVIGMLVASQGIIVQLYPPQDLMAFSAKSMADDTALREIASVPENEADVAGGGGLSQDGTVPPEETAPMLSQVSEQDAGTEASTLAWPDLPYMNIAALAAFGVIAAFCAATIARKTKKSRF